jgi:hypothetical protein
MGDVKTVCTKYTKMFLNVENFLTWSPMPVIMGMFQYEANRATGSRAKAQAGPMKAMTLS